MELVANSNQLCMRIDITVASLFLLMLFVNIMYAQHYYYYYHDYYNNADDNHN